jgi:hypothetical protein
MSQDTETEAAIPAKVPPRSVKPPRWMNVECAHCHEVMEVDRALAAPCPLCDVMPGQPCIDMRSKAKGKIVPLAKIHQQRVSHLTLLNSYPDPNVEGNGW